MKLLGKHTLGIGNLKGLEKMENNYKEKVGRRFRSSGGNIPQKVEAQIERKKIRGLRTKVPQGTRKNVVLVKDKILVIINHKLRGWLVKVLMSLKVSVVKNEALVGQGGGVRNGGCRCAVLLKSSNVVADMNVVAARLMWLRMFLYKIRSGNGGQRRVLRMTNQSGGWVHLLSLNKENREMGVNDKVLGVVASKDKPKGSCM
ncbi:hypothetical protein Tco_0861706 [Tanacetum coccineum]|uniref:Uncharacterized protein n=1 Tax=Tanacetum coccineum TaxID=301880 RepID=A0ABQ5BP73_9ASTR